MTLTHLTKTHTTGLVQAPVIAVPTSVGYGIGANGERARPALSLFVCARGRPRVFHVSHGTHPFKYVYTGIAPLMTMLNACAPGVAVVNIDVRAR